MPGRSLDLLIQSVQFFNPNIVLVFIGELNEYYRQVLLPEVEKNDLSEKVYFIPYIQPDQIMPYVVSADLGMVIYKNTNLNNYYCAPTKFYEYIMAEVPVIACNFPEILFTLQQYKIGLTFDPDDPKSIAQAVNQFLRLNEQEISEIKQNLKKARDRYTWENESQTFMEALQTLR